MDLTSLFLLFHLWRPWFLHFSVCQMPLGLFSWRPRLDFMHHLTNSVNDSLVSLHALSWSGCLSNKTPTLPLLHPLSCGWPTREDHVAVNFCSFQLQPCILLTNPFTCLWLVNFLIPFRDYSRFGDASHLLSSHLCRSPLLPIPAETQGLQGQFPSISATQKPIFLYTHPYLFSSLSGTWGVELPLSSQPAPLLPLILPLLYSIWLWP